MSVSLGNISADLAKALEIWGIIEPLIPELGAVIQRLHTNLSVSDIAQLQAEVEDARRENEIALERAKAREAGTNG